MITQINFKIIFFTDEYICKISCLETKCLKIDILAQVAQLKSGRGGEPGGVAVGGHVPEEGGQDVAVDIHQGRVLTGEALMGRVGSLKLYEILIGLLFISVIISWNPYTLPL
jgi:hypothetical protein